MKKELNQISVDIILPNYNSAPYLAETIDSKFFWLRNCSKVWMSLDQLLTKSLGQLRSPKNVG